MPSGTLSDPRHLYLRQVQDWDEFVRTLPGVSVRGNEAYLTIDAALAAIDWVEDHDATLLGFEGFRLTDDGIWPSLDHIADFSPELAPTPGQRVEMGYARDLLRQWRAEVDAVVLVIDLK